MQGKELCYLTAVRMRPHEGTTAFKIEAGGTLKESHSKGRSYGPFDHIFTPSATNAHVYEELIESLLDGYRNGQDIIVVLFGGSGSGKSYTLQGRDNQDGIAYRSLRELLHDPDSLESNAISLHEYPYGKRGLGENAFRLGTEILAARTYINVDDAIAAYTTGLSKRAVAATAKHGESSRSVLELRVSCENSTLSFFDLPGKEFAAAKPGSSAHTLSKWINTGYSEMESLLSLLQLGKSSEAREGVRKLGKTHPGFAKVVERLCDGAAPLGIACIDPSFGNPDELKRSRGTLALAEKFRKIKRVASEHSDPLHMTQTTFQSSAAQLKLARRALEDLRIENLEYQSLTQRLAAENEVLEATSRNMAEKLRQKEEILAKYGEKGDIWSTVKILGREPDTIEPHTPEQSRRGHMLTLQPFFTPGPASDLSPPSFDKTPESSVSPSPETAPSGLHRQLLEIIAGRFMPVDLQADLQNLLEKTSSDQELNEFLTKTSVAADEHRKMLLDHPKLILALQHLHDAHFGDHIDMQLLKVEPLRDDELDIVR